MKWLWVVAALAGAPALAQEEASTPTSSPGAATLGETAPTPSSAEGPAAAQGSPAPAVDIKYRLQDARPAEEKTSKLLSVWIWNCGYGITRLGDASGLQDRMIALDHDLKQAFGAHLQGREVIVDHYTVYVNGHSAEVGRSWGAGLTLGVGGAIGGGLGGAVGGNPKTTHASCPREKMKGGWFDASEITTPYTPYIVEITVRIDGSRVSARSVFSPSSNVSENSIMTGVLGFAEAGGGNTAIDKADAALIAEIRKQVPALADASPGT
jgi:hypothetical protein